MLILAKQEVHSAQYAKIKNVAISVKNEVMEMIAKARERKGRLDLPIVSGKHLRRISDRTANPMQLHWIRSQPTMRRSLSRQGR